MRIDEYIFDGERAVPLAKNMDTGVLKEHISRYEFASKLVKGKVLDAASGVGYGCEALSRGSQSVTGIDISESTIIYAKRTYGKEKIYFLVSDITRLPLIDGYFDFVVSFETLEHVRDGKAVINGIARVLKRDGTLIMSVPMGGPSGNKYHANHYQRGFFRWFMLGFFKEVNMLYQKGTEIRIDSKSPYFHSFFTGEYMIAVCRYPRIDRINLLVQLKVNLFCIINSTYNYLVIMKRYLKSILKKKPNT